MMFFMLYSATYLRSKCGMGLADWCQDFISSIYVGCNPYAWFIYGLLGAQVVKGLKKTGS